MANAFLVTVFVIIALGTVGTVIVVPIVSQHEWTIPKSVLTESPHPTPFLARICDPDIFVHPLAFATTERQLSLQYFSQAPSLDIPDPRGLSMWVMAWGQFIDHDIALSKANESDPAGPYMIPFNSSINITLNRVAFRPAGKYRESLQEISPYIDATTVYGDYLDYARMLNLRVSGDCKLRLDSHGLPPISEVDGNFYCGDRRCGEHVTLTILHTLFVREHNRLCDVIQVARPLLTVEQRYRVARRTVIAEIQHITFTQWLPDLLGSQYSLLQSVPLKEELGPRLTIPFAVSAYRFGHSMVPNNVGPFPLSTLFFNNNFLRTNGLEATIHFATKTRAQKVDSKVVNTLQNMLFGEHGMDLVTMNLFRQRELNVPRYTQLCACYGTTPQFAAGSDQDLDPFIGLLGEELATGSSLPPTIAHIVAEQFARLRQFDPLFYTNPAVREQIGPYLYEIAKSTTLSDVMRRNTGISGIKQNVFYV